MATAVLFISWNRPHIGREEQAYSYLMKQGLSYLHGLQGEAFERLELIGLTAHRGDLNGCVILFGERVKLDELRRSDEFESFVMNMNSLFDRLGVVPGINEAGISAMMRRRAESAHTDSAG